MLLPTDRSTLTTINTIIAAEALTRYDDEHQKPLATSTLAEESSYYGGDGEDFWCRGRFEIARSAWW